MDRFAETLTSNLKEDERKVIAQSMVADATTKGSKVLKDLDRCDWSRVEFADPRDVRTTAMPWELTNQKDFTDGIWLTCAVCRLRLMYCPTWGEGHLSFQRTVGTGCEGPEKI